MPRVKIDLPTTFQFTTELSPRYSDINMANHVANNAFVSLINEAYLRFLNHFALFDLTGKMIVADLAMIHRSEAHYGETLRIEVAIDHFGEKNCELFYRITEKISGREVLIAKNYIVFFDYEKKKSMKVPERLASLFAGKE
jgi:acyl-CoA thioester hydrolase